MFDPKDLIDIIIAGQNKGTAPMRENSRGNGGLGGLGDIMSDILGSAPETRDTYQRPVTRQAQKTPQGMPELGDIFGDIFGGGAGKSQAQPTSRSQDPSGQLKDIFDQMTRGRTERQTDYQQRKQAPEDYGRGMGSGMNTGDILGKAKDIFIANPTLGAVVLGGLGSLVLGSKSGRSLIGKGIKLGGAAMIGKMAWDAYNKYSDGKMAGGNQEPYRRETHYQENRDFDPNSFELPQPIEPEAPAPAPAPQGSGFETEAQSGENAILLLRTMIAASATDGEVDRDERKAIIDNLKQLGLDADAMSFIEDEFNNPATVAELAGDTPNDKVAAQVYTAARITIHPDTRDEVYFLQSLAEALKLPAGLVANIDYAANAAKS